MRSDDLTAPPDGLDDVLDTRADLDDRDDDASRVHHVDAIELRSLGVVAGLFYLTAFFILALAIACVYLGAAALGLIEQVEDFMRSIGFRDFHFVGPEVIFGFILLLAALVVFLTVMTLVAGAFYNMLGTGRHGIRLRLTEVGERRTRHERREERRERREERRAARRSIDVPDDVTEIPAPAPLAEEPAAAAAVAAAPFAAAVDEETSVDDCVKAPDVKAPAAQAPAAAEEAPAKETPAEEAPAKDAPAKEPAAKAAAKTKVTSTVKKAPTTAKRPATKPPARKKTTSAKSDGAKPDGAKTDAATTKAGEETIATPLVFEPVPDDATEPVGGNGAKKSDTPGDDDEPKPEAVAG